MSHGLSGSVIRRRFATRASSPPPRGEVDGLWEAPAPSTASPPKVFSTIRSFAAQLRPLESPRVLVVDDEDRVRRFIERVLRDAGCGIFSADSGDAALRYLDAGETFDLIVSDVRMPAMTGPEFVERARARHAGIRVLYLTGYNDDLFRARTALSDGDAFLDKPCTVKGLLEAVSLMLYGQLAPPAK
jgi:CheY-like chemotaxis protein